MKKPNRKSEILWKAQRKPLSLGLKNAITQLLNEDEKKWDRKNRVDEL